VSSKIQAQYVVFEIAGKVLRCKYSDWQGGINRNDIYEDGMGAFCITPITIFNNKLIRLLSKS
jgi:hypothetical protein